MQSVAAIRDGLVRRRWYAAAGAFSTIAATIRSRELVRVSYDGQDWRHAWGDSCTVYSAVPWSDPRQLTEQFQPLFFHAYRPGPGDVVVDCGAGIGTEIGILSRLVGASGRVIAIEAGPDAYRRLTRMVADLPLRNVETVQVAVSDWSGDGRFVTTDVIDGVNDSLVRVGADAVLEAGAVHVATLEEVLGAHGVDRIDYLRMNIEGEEARALRGLGGRLSDVRNVCVSCHDFTGRPGDATHDEVRALLAENGFEISGFPAAAPGSAAAFYVFGRRPAS